GLRLEHVGLRERTLPRERHQRFVGRRAPEEEREPRGEVGVADRVPLAGPRRGWNFLEAEDEMRAGENRLERRANAVFESAALLRGAAIVERHERFHIVR